MKSVALYSVKGGVGKTTLATSLAWASAVLSSRLTALWDLDPQAGATFILDGDRPGSREARAVLNRDITPFKLLRPTSIRRLSLLPADRSLRDLDVFFHTLGKKGRLTKLLGDLDKSFDRIILDCPPGLTETTTQVLRAADLIVVPVIPSALSLRALEELAETFDSRSIPRQRLMPVFNLVDRRRSIHLEVLEAHKDWPVVPVSSALEAMSARKRPLGALPSSSPAAQALKDLWRRIERRLARG